MSDDETIVRQRLSSLLARRVPESSPATTPVARPAAPSHPSAVPEPYASGGPLRSIEPYPSPGRGRPGRSLDPGSSDGPPPSPGGADAGTPAEAAPSVADATSGPGAIRPSRLPGPYAFDPGRRGVRALAVLAVVVVLAAGGWAWWSRPRAEPVPIDSTAGVAVSGAPAAMGGLDTGAVGPGSSGTEEAPGDAEVVVAVAGKVRRPGLVRLPPGARVADALEAAGGALPGVDVALLNLARRVTDGELILVGVTAPPGAGQPGAPGGAPGPGVGSPGAPGGGRVNLNTATLAELDALPGVGPVLAQRIVDHRTRQGPFRAVSDLRQVNGIGDARYEELKNLVTV